MRKNTENCEGYNSSNCCGAYIDIDFGICSDCKEHAGTQCEDCEDPCEDIQKIN